ncbi:MAG TPA: hypothetical protein VI685_20985 [Candidatus Angelobacter sp.]
MKSALRNPGAFQATSSTSDQQLNPVLVTGAKVESIKLDPSSQTTTVRIRNLSDKDITAFGLVIQKMVPGKRPEISDISHSIRDLLPGTDTIPIEGIRPGAARDEVLNVSSADVTVALGVVVYSDATAEFSNREMLMQIMAERKATMDAARQTEEIVRSSSSKAEAVYRLTQLWEESRMNHLLTASQLETHLYNLKNQHADSEAGQKREMMDYADKNEKDAEFLSFHANLRRRAQ